MINIRDIRELESQVLESTNLYTYTSPIPRFFANMLHRTAARYSSTGILLDLCCGMGNHYPFTKPGHQYIGVDSSERWIAIARKRFPQADFRKADISNLAFQDHSVDTIVSLSALEHIRDLGTAIREARRVIKDSGNFIIGLPAEGFLYRLGRYFTTKRRMEKMFSGINYLRYCEKEHLNDTSSVVKQTKRCFQIVAKRWLPFLLPSRHMNIWLLLQCIPLKV